MSRTLSIGNEGPRSDFFRPGPIYPLRNSPLTARVGSTPVWQFNIRPSRRMRRCIRCYGRPSVSSVFLAWRLRRRTKNPRMGADARRAQGIPGKTRICARRSR